MPAPNKRNVGASLAHKIEDHSSGRGAADDRSRFVASRVRNDKKWEEAAAALTIVDQAASRLSPKARQEHEDDKAFRAALATKADRANGTAAFRYVMDLPCERHDARPGEPCWVVDPDHRALCAGRARARGYR